MSVDKVIVNIFLFVVYAYFFGQKSFHRFIDKSVITTKHNEKPSRMIPPGKYHQYTLEWFKILMFWSWDLYHICTTLMIISSYSEDFCHLQPLRASHRKFSGTVGDIENRTSPNPPFMGIQTSVCGH